ncbi:sigma-70 family RNA polymerase sigma factor [Natronosporangium hydrolyticum]|uniref:Sigma-70 family RNA polymerase sigma factor n=1 Tax=Natronosporangium hydrolyticum TaxID=2811111 RepID=A0A895YCP7_9ACTN|nr:sigma-70 family RNA polymerase sigma factor [Natronosporangium hydrolyticum]QSB13119.1 sigma-70 family RNA polymerase sigma factor [Natronosporangium hydrolyticum]
MTRPAAATGHGFEELLRELAPQVLGAVCRRYADFAAAEDAVQEALLAAAVQWPASGVPESPRGWLIQVAFRRLTDQTRSDQARRRREELVTTRTPVDQQVTPPADHDDQASGDDSLSLLFLCCHPALSPPGAIALTLRAVGGLTTAEIARAFLIPEPTMAQRITRAKQRIKAAGARFAPPDAEQWPARLREVQHVLYLIFNEGYAATAGEAVQRTDLTAEAIRLTRLLHRLAPTEPEVAGLLALMLLTDARRAARTGPDRLLVPLTEQRRDRWDNDLIAEGTALLTRTLGTGPVGPYQLQAAIAAVHDEAESVETTDWRQILALYEVLERVAPGPVVTLNRAVAVAMVHGPRAGLALLGTLDADARMTHSHRLAAARGHLLEQAGEIEAAQAAYRSAATMTASRPEQRYLTMRAARLGD